MSEITIKVSSAELKSKAREIKKQISVIKQNWESLKKTVENSTTYWEGNASDMHQSKLKKQVEAVERVLKRLGEHPTDLLEMAGIYEEVEETVKQKVTELPTSII